MARRNLFDSYFPANEVAAQAEAERERRKRETPPLRPVSDEERAAVRDETECLLAFHRAGGWGAGDDAYALERFRKRWDRLKRWRADEARP